MDELMKPEPTWPARLETLRGRLTKGPGYLPVLAAAFTRVRRVGHTAAAIEVARRIGAVFVVADELAAADTRLRAAPGVRVVSLLRAESTLRGLSRPIVIDHFAMEKVINRVLEIGRDAFAVLELLRGLEAQNDQLRHELQVRAGELAEAKARQEMAEQAACGWAMDCGRLEARCDSAPPAATLYEAVRWVLDRAQTDPEFVAATTTERAAAVEKVTRERDEARAGWESAKADYIAAKAYHRETCVELEATFAARDAARAEVERVRDALHRDQTGLATALERVSNEIAARHWIAEGRGCYEWDDDRYKEEAGAALRLAQQIALDALHASGRLARAALSPAPPPKEDPPCIPGCVGRSHLIDCPRGQAMVARGEYVQQIVATYEPPLVGRGQVFQISPSDGEASSDVPRCAHGRAYGICSRAPHDRLACETIPPMPPGDEGPRVDRAVPLLALALQALANGHPARTRQIAGEVLRLYDGSTPNPKEHHRG